MASKKSLWYLRGYYFFYFAMVGIYVVFLPKILLDIGYTSTQIGVIYASAPMMRFLIPFVFKHYLKLTYNAFVISLLLSIVAIGIFFFTIDGFWGYLGANLFFGVSVGISLPFVEAYALSILSKTEYGKIRLWGSVGFMITILILAKIMDSATVGLYALIMMAILTAILGVMTTTNSKKALKDSVEDARSFSISKYKYLWLSLFLMQLSFGGFYNFFTIYETAHGISLVTASYLWSFGVLCEIAMLYFQGPLLKNNLLGLLKFATFATSIRWLILYLFPSSLFFAYLSQGLHAFSFALYHTAAISYIFHLYSQKKLAQQFYLGIAFGLGGSLGAIIAGRIYGEYLFLIESIIALFAFIFLYLQKEKYAPK